MPGPAPQSLRVRPNVPTRGDWVTLPAAKFTGVQPELKGLDLEGPLGANAKKAWEWWWGSPMAHQWTEAEWPMLKRMLLLTELINRSTRRSITAGLAPLLSELRQLEDRLGISEKGRRDLRWLLPDPNGEEEPKVRRRKASSSEMRKRLTVVDGG